MGMIDFAPLFRPPVGYDQLLELLDRALRYRWPRTR